MSSVKGGHPPADDDEAEAFLARQFWQEHAHLHAWAACDLARRSSAYDDDAKAALAAQQAQAHSAAAIAAIEFARTFTPPPEEVFLKRRMVSLMDDHPHDDDGNCLPQ